jgi:hypothetical protein
MAVTADFATMAILSSAVRQPQVQAVLRDLGRYVGRSMVGGDDPASAANKLAAMSTPGTWEHDVLVPLVQPVLEGVYDTGAKLFSKYAWATGIGGLVLLAGTNYLSFVLGRRSGDRG